MIPLLVTRLIAQGGVLSDIEFLSIKEFEDKVRSDEGTLSTTGDLATLTANVGKDMYIASAKVVFYVLASAFEVNNQVALKINGVTIEIARAALAMGSNGGTSSIVYEFKNIGHKVTTGQIIKLEVLNLNTDVDVVGFIECFEEDTDATPQIPAI